jgi:tetratricopeptide (TPR) repeat protein
MDWSKLDLAAGLRAGGGLGTVLFAVLPAPTRQALRRCATQRSFDASLYDELLRPPDGPGLDELVQDGHVELASGEVDRYRLVASIQEPAFGDWWTEAGRPPGEPPVPEPLRELAAAAARHHAAGRPLDALDQLLLCDQPTARSRFVELYDVADTAHDLPGCQALLDVVDSPYRLPLIDRDLLELRHDRSAYLAARNLWSTAFYQSARYLPRRALEQALEDLLDGRGGRILQIHARGGMGKTMQLRWFIARRCVPAPNRIPCARIDLDTVAAVAATRHPWLLLVELAAQLDLQLTYGPFQDLLASYSSYRVLLSHAPDTTEVPVSADDVDGEDISARFTGVLTESAADRPVVLAFDSMEQLFRLDGKPTGLLRLLGRLQQDAPSLRMVLAGRYDLRQRLPDLPALLPAVLRSVQLGPLDGQDQRRYLRQGRGIHDPELVDAIVRRSGGTPFLLGLLADLADAHPGIDAPLLDELAGRGMTGLVERVLASVDDDRLRWLLRYGVVPRVLTFRFFAEVMAPVMSSVPTTEAELTDLWRRLVKYASTSAWVTAVHEEKESVRFHPEIVPVQRTLIREDPVTVRLHLAAAPWFAAIADEHPDKWTPYASESIYHAFQTDPAAGVTAWRRAIDTARKAGRPDWVLELTGELLGRGGGDEGGEDAGREGVPPQMLVEAHLERGRASAELAQVRREPGEHSLWCDAEASLRAAQALARSASTVRLPEPAATVLEARVLIAHGRAEEAEALLRARSTRSGSSPGAAELERALGDALDQLGRGDAADHYRRSYELAAEAGETPGARLAVLSLARQRTDRCRIDQALEWLDLATESGHLAADDELAVLVRASALDVAGLPMRAARVLEEFTRNRPNPPVTVAATQASLLLAADRPEQAVAACSKNLQRLSHEPGPSADLTAGLLATRGTAYGALLEFEPAVSDLLLAATRARELRDLDAAADYATRAATVQLLDIGDLRGAAQAVDEAERLLSEPGHWGWVVARVARALLLDRMGQPAAARELLDSIWPVLGRTHAGPAAWLHTAVGGLTLRPSSGDTTCLRVLVEQLEEVQPPVARLRPLAGLRNAASRAAADPGLTNAFVDVVLSGWLDAGRDPPPAPAEQVPLRLIAAEVLRLVGRNAEARDVLDRATDLRHDSLLWWRWLQVQHRIGPAGDDTLVPPDGLGLAVRYPVLGAAYLITLAEHRLQVDGYDHAVERLDRATALLSRPGRAHHWTARLLEAKAEVASRGGQHETALRSAAGAVRTWGGLGDDSRQRKLGDDYNLGSVRGEPDAGTLELRLSRIVEDEPRVQAVASLPNGAEIEATSSMAVVGDRAGGTATDRVRSAVGLIMQDWRAWAVAAAELLPADARKLLASGGTLQQRLDVRLVTAHREPAAIPWELVRLPEAADQPLVGLPTVATVFRGLPTEQRDENRIRALQAVLQRLGLFSGVVDGLMGSVTSQALRDFQAQAGIAVDGVARRATWAALRSRVEAGPRRPGRVLLIRPDRIRELGRRRGATVGGTDLVSVYRRHGAAVEVLEDPTPARLRAYGGQEQPQPPDVVHVAGMAVLLSGATVLDLGGDAAARAVVKGAARADQLSVSALGELLAALDDAPYGPVVVLDVAAPPTQAEAARSLLVRNSLAHQLICLGHAVAIIATGMAAPADQDRLYELLLGGLVAGDDPATVVRRLHTAEPRDAGLRATLPFQGTALYLHRPPFTLLPLGLA